MSANIPSRPPQRAAYWVAEIFAVLAVVLALSPLPFQTPVTSPDLVPTSVIDPTPVRQPSLSAVYTLGKFTYRCNECHRSTPTPYAAGHGLTKHADVFLSHGINARCLNCHHPVNRETFVDDFGQEIPWDQPQLLCTKCHGPVYRDWQHGSHGRINGYWDTSQGEQIRLKCIECHDPHHPPFPPLASAPGPKTLRTQPHGSGTHEGARNPLRVVDDGVTDGSSQEYER